MNLWLFVQSTGPMHLVHELGARPYVMSGSDVEMTRLLKELAISDFHFAQRFPVPDRYSLELEDEVDGNRSTRKGICAADPAMSRHDQLKYFKEALDEVEAELPTRRMDGQGTARLPPPINRKNLLFVITSVAVFDDGRQLALVDHPLRNRPVSAATNLWAFADAKTKTIHELSGRAYMVHGSERDRDRVLTALSPFDFSLARTTANTLAVSSDGEYDKSVFDGVFQSIDGSIPPLIGIDKKVKNRAAVSARGSRLLATLMVERAGAAIIDASPITLTGREAETAEKSEPAEPRRPKPNGSHPTLAKPPRTAKIVEAPAPDSGAWVAKAAALARLDRHGEALACYDRALAIDLRRVDAWIGKGGALDGLDRLEEALVSYDHALAIDLRGVDAWIGKGDALNRVNRLEEALACYDHALAIDPRSPRASANKGGALNRLGRHDEALACCERALALDPTNADAWINKGDALNRLDRLEEALVGYDHALAIDQRSPRAWANKGDALNGLKRHAEALACCDRALAIDQGFTSSWNNKGLALERLERHEDALVCYIQALGIDPGETWAQSARYRVYREMIHYLY
jgi:tetratricopeptide (TPR) repeat protein